MFLLSELFWSLFSDFDLSDQREIKNHLSLICDFDQSRESVSIADAVTLVFQFHKDCYFKRNQASS